MVGFCGAPIGDRDAGTCDAVIPGPLVCATTPISDGISTSAMMFWRLVTPRLLRTTSTVSSPLLGSRSGALILILNSWPCEVMAMPDDLQEVSPARTSIITAMLTIRLLLMGSVECK